VSLFGCLCGCDGGGCVALRGTSYTTELTIEIVHSFARTKPGEVVSCRSSEVGRGCSWSRMRMHGIEECNSIGYRENHGLREQDDRWRLRQSGSLDLQSVQMQRCICPNDQRGTSLGKISRFARVTWRGRGAKHAVSGCAASSLWRQRTLPPTLPGDLKEPRVI